MLIVSIAIPKVTTTEVQAKNKNGFTYSENEFNVEWKSYESFNVYTDQGGRLGTTSYVVGLARCKKSNDYMLMAKEVMTPNKNKVLLDRWNYGYGISEYVSAKVTLPSLNDYQPKNDPGTDQVNLSLGASKGGPEVGLSYEIKHNDLDITSKCNTPSKQYYEVYDYQPSIACPWSSNKYVANESIQLGLAEFETRNGTVSFQMNYDARYGSACEKNAAPWYVNIGYVRKATKSRNYSFTISKN